MDHYLLWGQPDCSRNAGHAFWCAKPDFDGDWHGRYFPAIAKRKFPWIAAFRIFEDPIRLTSGRCMYYHDELASAAGVSRLLVVEPEHTAADLAEAKQNSHHTNDIVSFQVIRPTAIVDLD